MDVQGWQAKRIELRYSISDLSLFRISFNGRVYRTPFHPLSSKSIDIQELPAHLSEEDEFAGLIDVHIDHPLPRINSFSGGYLYCLNQTHNYFIEVRGSFEDYLRILTPKTRSTLKRKVRKFSSLSDGAIDFRTYRIADQMRDYHRLARDVARLTYQEKLFQGAIPESEEFRRELERLAATDQVRGFLLFLQGRPIAYLYVPIVDGVAVYAYLGYDPHFAEHSPGTVLLYLAIENLFTEQRLKYFNFGYGENQTKQVFSTGQFLRADIYLFRKSFKTSLGLYGHTLIDDISELSGRVLDRMGLRRLIRHWLRST
jgi:hypothetical protein